MDLHLLAPGLFLLAFALSLPATWTLARLAPRLGWGDAGDGVRKLQVTPLAPVGGVAVAVAVVIATVQTEAIWGVRYAWGDPYSVLGVAVWPVGALGAALLVGLVDDLVPGGLRPSRKLAGQALAGLAMVAPELARGADDPARLLAALGLAAGAMVAMNAMNTWDNADGAAAGLGVLALGPAFSGALAGFLPLNLRRRGGRPLVRGLPHAILGDAGSHALGMLLWLAPSTWPALALPLADLARVAVERMSAGQAPWVGDRRHLAHRLERQGASPLLVAGLLALAAWPSAGPAAAAVREGDLWRGLLWTLATLGMGAALVGTTRRAGEPCREPGGPG